jgi:sulfate/thiosulfate transport system substrate-binding protein
MKSAATIRRIVTLFLVGIGLSVAIAACSGGKTVESGNGQKPEAQITLVSFAVTKAAHEAIIPKFVAKWQQEHGQKVTFKQSYGGSASQTRAVIDGLAADVVHLSLAGDTQKIEKAGLIAPGWEKKNPNDSNVSRSVAVLVTRPGNPKGIKDWTDLAKDGVKVITANPKTSGVAKWNFLALWNSATKTGDEAKAQEFVKKVYQNAPILPKDAREATDIFFKQGQGDILINYENEIILAQQKGQKAEYIVPAVNISIDNPIAVVDKNVDKHGNRAVAEAFVKYLFTPEAQAEFAKVGFRPADPTQATKFPAVKQLSTIKDFGGWSAAQTKFFDDRAIFDKIQAK